MFIALYSRCHYYLQNVCVVPDCSSTVTPLPSRGLRCLSSAFPLGEFACSSCLPSLESSGIRPCVTSARPFLPAPCSVWQNSCLWLNVSCVERPPVRVDGWWMFFTWFFKGTRPVCLCWLGQLTAGVTTPIPKSELVLRLWQQPLSQLLVSSSKPLLSFFHLEKGREWLYFFVSFFVQLGENIPGTGFTHFQTNNSLALSTY